MAGKKEVKLVIKIAGAIDPSLAASLDSISDKLKGGVGKLDGAFNNLDPAFDKLESAGKKCFDTIAVAATAAAGAIAVVGDKVLEAGMSFEEQMSTVEAITGAGGADMDALADRAKEIGRTTQFTATEAGEAMEYMGMAGWETLQILDGISGVMDLAAASGEDLAMVSDIVTDDMTAFGMAADETQRFVDVLAAAATSANTNVELMGETFQYAAPLAGTMGYSIEDVAIATGLMADNGIKGSMAGTALRNLFQRMAKPTKESAAAMEDLDLSLTNADGSMRSLMDIMLDLRESLGGHIEGSEEFLSYLDELNEKVEEGSITEEQATEAMDEYIAAHDELTQSSKLMEAAMLAGSRGMAGLLAIVNTSEEDFNRLTDSITNSAGAAERMADIRLDNLQGDVKILQSAMEGLEIAIFEEVNPAFRDLAEYATGVVTDLSDWLPEMIGNLAETIEENLPRAIQKVKDIAEPILDLTHSVFGFIIDHSEEIVGVVAGIGTAIVTYEIASNVTHIVEWLMKLDPISLTILTITTAVGAIAGHLTTIRLEHEKLVDQSLADHFGDISLSLSELNEIAEQVAGSGQLERIRNVLDEFSTLDETKQGLKEISEQLDKADWKVSVGLVLSEEDKKNYQANIQSLIEETNALLQQSWNADISAASEGLTGSGDFVDRLSRFYAAKQGELTSIGTQLNNAITEAFQDGFLDFDETQVISNLRQKMADVQSELSSDEFDIQMRMIDRMNFGELDDASYENLLKSLRDAYNERVEGINRVWAATTQANEKQYNWERDELRAQMEAHEITAQEFAEKMQALNKSYQDVDSNALSKLLGDQADAIRRVAEGGTGGLLTQYADEISTAQRSMTEVFGDIAAGFSSKDWELMTEAPEEFAAMVEEISVAVPDALNRLYKATGQDVDIDAMSKLTEKLKPTAEDIDELVQAYEDAGEELPQGLIDGMENVDLLMALTGDEKALYNQLLKYLSEEHPQYGEMMDSAALVGGSATEGVAEGMTSPENLAKIDEGATKLYDEVDSALDDVLADGFDKTADVNIELNPVVKSSGFGAAVSGLLSGFDLFGIGEHAEGGFVSGKQLSWLAEEGPEVVIPLNNSERAISLWEQTGAVLDAKSRMDEAELSDEVTNNSMVVTFAPVYNISGNTTKADAEKIAQDGFKTFQKYMEQYTRRNNRVLWERG